MKSIFTTMNIINLHIERLSSTVRILIVLSTVVIACSPQCVAISADSVTGFGHTRSVFHDAQFLSLSAKTTHIHQYRTKSIKCNTGLRTMICSCGKTKMTHGKKGHICQKVKDGFYIIEKCKSCGKTLKKYLSKDVPNYWNNNIVTALKKSSSRRNLPGYVYLTDPHWSKNAGRSPAIVNYVVRQMGYSYAVCGGDIVTGCYGNKQDAIEEIKDFYDKFSVPVLTVMGNHDANRNGNSNPNTFLSTYDINKQMYARNPSGTHLSNGGDFAFIDDARHHVRYITFFYDETSPASPEVIDSIDRAVTSLDADWSVVLLSHAYWHRWCDSVDQPAPRRARAHRSCTHAHTGCGGWCHPCIHCADKTD